jgi:hypothetical protein
MTMLEKKFWKVTLDVEVWDTEGRGASTLAGRKRVVWFPLPLFVHLKPTEYAYN